jgi:hypothetical protein
MFLYKKKKKMKKRKQMILKKSAKKRFSIDNYGPLAADSSISLVLTKFIFDPQRLYRSL